MRRDRIWSAPTTYSGVNLRSQFEKAFAQLIDALDYHWQYEPVVENFGARIYSPDFFVSELALIAECRGYDDSDGEDKLYAFSELVRGGLTYKTAGGEPIQVEYLVLGPHNCQFFEYEPDAPSHHSRTDQAADASSRL